MIRRRIILNIIKMDAFLPILEIKQSTSTKQNKTTLPTPPLTPRKMIIPSDELLSISSSSSSSNDSPSPDKKISTPTFKKKFIQASRSLFNRPNESMVKSATFSGSVKTKYDELRFYLEEINSHFEAMLVNSPKNETSNNMTLSIYRLTSGFLINYKKCLVLNEKIIKNAKKYDYNEECELNGYRTLNATFEKCCLQSLSVVKSIYKQKQNVLLQVKFHLMNSFIKEYETWCLLVEKLVVLFEIANEMQEKTAQTNSLLINHNSISANIEKSLFLLASTNQEAFFGRSCAFQFCDSLRLPLTACTVALASYNESYDVTTGANGNDLVRKTA